MRTSNKCEKIVKDIVCIFDEINIPLEERGKLIPTTVRAYFRGMVCYREDNFSQPTDKLRQNVLYRLKEFYRFAKV